MKKSLKSALAVTAAAGLVALAGCSSEPTEALDNGDQQDITVAVFNGWPEGEAVSYLWQAVLEEEGYNVELEYAEVVTGFEGLASGDYDVNLDVWLPVTHESYLESYGDEIVDLGTWNNEATNNIAVNADAPVESLEDLAANAELFGSRIVGIEPGAGLTGLTQDAVIPGYGLDDWTLETSSTAAMLTELTAAEESGENIAVTLWHPHWAYDAFDIKDLADPQGALGDAEGIHSFARADFESDYPTASEWISNFEMDTDTLGGLQNAMFGSEADSSEYEEIVATWISENQEWVDGLTS
ncbi:MAG TPA: glycine betaine ABC transporter substrate-binding protein [Glaciihabitans sp.]|jgi:glycine betaine/proline transport system substrate-binding protein|nr:glycine betaine ABC transporter substrate-binding protein [Glaciihabitans sp.]